MSEPSTVLSLRGVSKRFADLREPVLDSVDLELAPGELVHLGGGNGAGKTTLLRLASGLLAPDAGRVEVTGHDLEHERASGQRRLGLLTAGNTGLYARLAVRAHLDFWTRIAFVPAARRSAAIEASLAAFGLLDLAARRVDRLSLGQRQRVRLALTFVHDPPSVVLLDEPRTSLDDEGAAFLRVAVARAVEAGTAVLWSAPTSGAGDPAFSRRLLVRGGRLEG